MQLQDAIEAEGQALAGVDASFALENNGIFRPLLKAAPEIASPALAFTFFALLGVYDDQPIRDPDLPDDLFEIRADIPLMKGLAQVVVEEEIGIRSMRTIWREHLYELSGFKDLFGDDVSNRLRRGEAVSRVELETRLPGTLSIGLRGYPDFESLESLRYEVWRREGNVVMLKTMAEEPTNVVLLLDFVNERLELPLDLLAYRPDSAKYTRELAASMFRFLIGLFSNGVIQVYRDDTGERLSFKDVFIAANIDLPGNKHCTRER